MKIFRSAVLISAVVVLAAAEGQRIASASVYDPWFQKEGLTDFSQKQDSWGHYIGNPIRMPT
jgi:hypothetical protein